MAKAKKQARRKMSWQDRVFAVAGLMLAVVFLPTTILLFIGMLPTLVAAAFTEGKGRGTRALAVGAMNLAGCSPFMIHLWTKGHHIDQTWQLLADPRTIVVIYAAAAIGYVIDWAVTGIVATLVFQKSEQRLKDIKKRQKKLVERWGFEITGEMKLDPYGFPLEGEQAKKDPAEDEEDGAESGREEKAEEKEPA